MNWVIRKLKDWHWLHSWSQWKHVDVAYVSFPWTRPECYAYKEITQKRSCSKCGKLEVKVVKI